MVYKISYKILTSGKPLDIRFDKVKGSIRVYYGSRFLVFFDLEKYNAIFNRTRYVICVKSGITYVISHNYARIKID